MAPSNAPTLPALGPEPRIRVAMPPSSRNSASMSASDRCCARMARRRSLDRLLHLLELLLRPDRGQIDAGGQQIFPLRGAWVRGSVRFPRFGMFRRATVGDIGRIVFVGQPREMVAELVHENVGRERIVGGDGGDEIEDAAAPV